MDATDNSVWALVPPKLVPPGGALSLLFQASFDNNVLDLAVGTPIRSEVIVSFGNATVGGNSTPDVDINGNGVIDTDEARIRSVPARLTVTVPAQVPGNATVTLTDALDDIATTGSVTFSNAQFNLGSTSGTVTATVDGGADGGTITNCAHLTSLSTNVVSGGFTFPVVNGLDLTACSTVDVGGSTCTPGAPGCGWEPGDMLTFNQGQWGAASGTAAGLLVNSFFDVYTAGAVEVGISGASGFSMAFDNPFSVGNYLPAFGIPGPLVSDLLNPTSSSSGTFGGEVVSLALNVDFSDDAFIPGTVPLGDLAICNLPPLTAMSVRSFLGVANTALGGGATGFNIADLSTITNQLNAAFFDGTPSAFAQDHLVNGACP